MRSADSSWLVFPHCSGPHLIRLVTSAVRCRLPTRVTLRQLPLLSPFVQFSSRVPLPTSGHAEISSPKPFLWFRAKTDKGIVCLADLRHSVTKWYQVFLSNANNLHAVVWFQVFLSITNNLYTIMWLKKLFLFHGDHLFAHSYIVSTILFWLQKLQEIIRFQVTNEKPR